MAEGLLDFFRRYNPISQALIATLFTWFVTAAGTSLVLPTKSFNQKIVDGMLGLAAGVMIAASYRSLLAPAIELAGGDWKTAANGFLASGVFLYIIDKILPHLHPGLGITAAAGIITSWQGSSLLVLAITLQNIPEGLAVVMPLRREGWGRVKSFLYGQASGWLSPWPACWASPS